jgi:hypothetical protein
MPMPFIWVSWLFVLCWCGQGAAESSGDDNEPIKWLKQQVWDPNFNSMNKRPVGSQEGDGAHPNGRQLMFGRLRMPMYYTPEYGNGGKKRVGHPAMLSRHSMRTAMVDKRQWQIPPEVDINLPLRFGKRQDDGLDINLPLRFGKRSDKYESNGGD